MRQALLQHDDLVRACIESHGGQVLLSAETRELLGDSLSAGTTLYDRGSHRLRDLSEPEQIFQLLHPDLEVEFPPLRSLSTHPNNLPQQLTTFVGREQETVDLRRLMEKTRLVTVTGSGGCGKTRLALQVAAEALERFPDGVWVVELAPRADPALVPQTVAEVLDCKEEPGKPILGCRADHVKGKHLLLVLDNCEHLLDACAKLADNLLRTCPQVRLLATSREGLGIARDSTYRVPSLSLPDPSRDATPESLARCESARLFVERAHLQQPDIAVSGEMAPILAAICARLDDIPLAIELATARLRTLSIAEIHARLDQRFRLLTGGSRTALPRHQTLRSLIDWSYDLLSEPEKVMLCRLSAFVGGWTLGAAEHVCAGEPIEEWEILDLLTVLTDKSLAVVAERGGETRYRLLETVRHYARELLLQRREPEALRRRHWVYSLRLARIGHDTPPWLERMAEDHDKLRAALEVCLTQEEHPEPALELASSLGPFWFSRSLFAEGRSYLPQVLVQSSREPTAARAGRALPRLYWHFSKETCWQLAQWRKRAWLFPGACRTSRNSSRASASWRTPTGRKGTMRPSAASRKKPWRSLAECRIRARSRWCSATSAATSTPWERMTRPAPATRRA
jgi:predicted ATPase